jgi:hypothetical protein
MCVKKEVPVALLLKEFKGYFNEMGFHKKGVLLESIMSHALYTNTDEDHHQHPHTGYMYPSSRDNRVREDQYLFSWTAIIPANSERTCLNEWEKPGYPMNIHIKCGEIFFFQSDVIHSGGQLAARMSKEKQLY